MNGVDKNPITKNDAEEKTADGVENQRKDDIAIEMNDEKGGSRNKERSKPESLCRICHFEDEESSGDCQLIALGCDCRGEMGVSHRSCADAWFKQKGNRVCEICGKTAINITVKNKEVDHAIIMMDVNETMLVMEAVNNSSNERSQSCNTSFCNFFMLCLLLAFVLPCFLPGIDIL